MSERRYVLRPKADHDLDEQAYYYANAASPELGHRFLIAAHDTFALLATQPNMGWRSRLENPELLSLRVFRVSGFERILIPYRPLPDGVEILRIIHGSRQLETLLLRNAI